MTPRPLVRRQPNEQLQALIAAAGCSNVGLARRVNMRGAEHGLDLRYDKTSVSRWLRGQQPRGRTPAIIAEVLSSKLGRIVSVDDIGMTGSRQSQASAAGLTFIAALPEAVEAACDLWRGDANRHGLQAGSVALSALLQPSRDWLIADPDATVSRIADQPVRGSDIELMTVVTRSLTEADHRFGSWHVRPVAVHYLDSVVSGLLRGSYDEALGRRLYSAAARLTELVGYMSVDSGKASQAQRYYIQALRLAQAAGDRGYGGYVLAAGMAHLAPSLGYPLEVAQLARAAQEGTRGHATFATQACLYAAEARGYALLQDARSCSLAAGKAADALEHVDVTGEPDWIAHFDRACLADELAHCYVDLRLPRPAADKAKEALAGYPENRVRRRVIVGLLLARAQLQAGDVDEACGTASQAVTALRRLRSSLGFEYLKKFRSELRRIGRETTAAEFEEGLDTARL